VFLQHYRRDPVMLLAAVLLLGAMLFFSHDIWSGYDQIKLHDAAPNKGAPAGAAAQATIGRDTRVVDSASRPHPSGVPRNMR
jgi:hypothetical protein